MKRTVKLLAGAVLTVGLMTTAAAAPAEGDIAALPMGPGPQKQIYTVDARSSSPVYVWGTVKGKEDGRIYLENSDPSDPNGKIYVNLTEDTYILNAVTGEAETAADLKQGETVHAYVGPAMTRSIPPIANGVVVLRGVPADYAVPTYAEVERVDIGEDGAVSLLTSRDVILHLNKSTELSPLAVPGLAHVDMAMAPEHIRPGTRVLAWYETVALSLPAQAAPTKVLVFPYEYESYVLLGKDGIAVDGDMIIKGVVEDKKLLLPLRALADTLGCEVAWDNAERTVSVTKNGQALYTVSIGGEAAQLGESGMALAVAPKLVDGSTYMALDDLLTLHNLKLSQ